MATYDLTSTTPEKIKTGDILNCPYSGSKKTVTLPAGTYKLECWGAQGGNNASSTSYGTGGKGGYSVGTLTLTDKATTLYLYAGGAGTSSTSSTAYAGGFNGGGQSVSYAGSGGGASDIRIGTDTLYYRVIVAGGGGGAQGRASTSYKASGGAGGGTSGQQGGYYGTDVNYTSNNYGGAPGTQTAAGTVGNSSYGNTAGSFGTGGTGGYRSTTYRGAGGGGGGWYGGGTGYYRYSGGGGGSGFVWTGSNAPSGYGLGSAYYLTDASTTLGTSSFLSPTGSSETGHSSNGYVRITVIKAKNGAVYKKSNGTWTEITDNVAGISLGFNLLASGSPCIITFTINDTVYYAEPGMIWGEWIASEYNTAGYQVINGYVMTSSGTGYLEYNSQNFGPDAAIVPGYKYGIGK